jgi:O-antigen ligase
MAGAQDQAHSRAEPRAPHAGTAWVAVLLALPWLWPWVSGPSANAWPLMFAWACLLLALPRWLAAGAAQPAHAAALPISFIAAAALSAVIGLAQYFGVAPPWDIVSPARLGEAYGNLRQRNQFASLAALGLAGLLWAAGRVRRGPALAVAALLGVANAASASRTGLLHLFLLVFLAAWWPGPRRERLQLCCTALAAYAVALVLLPAALWQWRGVEPATAIGRAFSELGCSSRKVLWSNVAELVAQRPWAGWGWGELDYAHYAHLYSGERFCDILDNAHNLPLHVAVEAGVPAAVLMLAVLGWAVLRGRPWREADGTRQLAWSALAIVALHSLLEYPLWYGPFQVACAGSVLVLLAPGPAGGRTGRLVAGSAAVLLAMLGAGALLYDRVSDAYRPPEQRRAALRHDPVGALGDPVLFADQVRFAQLAITPLTAANARQVHELAERMLHYSPEPMVVEKLVESALALGRDEEAALHMQRFRAAFPDRYREWLRDRGGAADTR